VCEDLAEACDKHAEIEAFSRCGEACRKCAEEYAKLAKLKRAAWRVACLLDSRSKCFEILNAESAGD
jgi:hypothetical protein